MVEAAKILRKHLNPFVQYRELSGQTVASEMPILEGVSEGPVDRELQERLSMPMSQLDLSVRASNCLESAKVATVGELVRMTEGDLLKVRSFGRTSLREVKRKLADLGLSLGMTFSDSGVPQMPPPSADDEGEDDSESEDGGSEAVSGEVPADMS